MKNNHIEKKGIKALIATMVVSAGVLAGIAINNNAADASQVYTIKPGDTISSISQKFNISVDNIVRDNPNEFKNGHIGFIKAGDQILINEDGVVNAPAQNGTVANNNVTSSTANSNHVVNTPAVNATTANQVAHSTSNSVVTPKLQQPVQQPVARTTSGSSNVASGSDSAAKSWIASHESGGSYGAQNGNYYGKYQLSSSYLGGDYSPANQERVANQYVSSRYGSWSGAQAFWQGHGWY